MEVILWQQGKERVPLAEKLLAEKRIQDVRRMICSRRALSNGTISLITEQMPVIAIATSEES